MFGMVNIFTLKHYKSYTLFIRNPRGCARENSKQHFPLLVALSHFIHSLRTQDFLCENHSLLFHASGRVRSRLVQCATATWFQFKFVLVRVESSNRNFGKPFEWLESHSTLPQCCLFFSNKVSAVHIGLPVQINRFTDYPFVELFIAATTLSIQFCIIINNSLR